MEKTAFDITQSNYFDIKQHTYEYAVLPWGATEPHNYHLPYLTDCYLAHHISIDAVQVAYESKHIKGMVLPYIPLGSQNPGQFDYPFCLHGSYQTQFSILKDIASSLLRQQIYKLFIVNGHGGNSFKNMVRDLAYEMPNLLIVVVDWFKVEPQASYFDNADDHAGEMETSVLMHYRPELVNLSLAGDGKQFPFKSQALQAGTGWTPRLWTRVSKDTGIGNPSQSTAEKGKRYAEIVVRKIAQLIIEVVTQELYTDED